ncbi:cytochrome C oxidase subunit IV family protein [Litorivivens sp.]|uniref:cytochrome C oxidase subunit IV family protein n=1 Tax=Litorivivens sp. TaxID=2020868 RepID=UPI00356A4D5E
MIAYLKNPLTTVWATLSLITVAAWLIGRNVGTDLQPSHAVTLSVLLIAAAKAQLVIMYFMEVRSAPRWLKRVAYGWVLVLFPLLYLTNQLVN